MTREEAVNWLMAELKPCPFCGDEAEVITNDRMLVFVRCRTCRMILIFGDIEKDAVSTAKRWNQREGDTQ